jgi:hypothetical protein
MHETRNNRRYEAYCTANDEWTRFKVTDETGLVRSVDVPTSLVLRLVARAAGWPEDMPVEEPAALVESVAELRKQAEIGRQWHEDSSLERWFPLTAERLKQAEARADELERLYQRENRAAVDMCTSYMRQRDELQAEVQRLRSRVRVEAEDIERAHVTWKHVEAWLHEKRPRYPTPRADAAPALLAYIIYDNSTSIADTWRILDEMSRMEVPK